MVGLHDLIHPSLELETFLTVVFLLELSTCLTVVDARIKSSSVAFLMDITESIHPTQKKKSSIFSHRPPLYYFELFLYKNYIKG